MATLILTFFTHALLAYANPTPTNVQLNALSRDHMVLSDKQFNSITAERFYCPNFQLLSSTVGMADFSYATLENSTWRNIEISQSWFNGADLRGAHFVATKLNNCSLAMADLRGAVFQNSILSNCNFWHARWNSKTQLPFDSETAEKLGMSYVP